MIELERTFLAKFIPEGIRGIREIKDIGIPKTSPFCRLRLRKIGDKIELTKKTPIDGDASKHNEITINLTEEEYEPLSKVEGKSLHKIRYLYDYNGIIAEVDVYQGPLKGLVLIDFEFKTEEEKDSFKMPDFCLADVTHDEFLAAGVLAGKNYEDIEEGLKKFNYKKLEVK